MKLTRNSYISKSNAQFPNPLASSSAFDWMQRDFKTIFHHKCTFVCCLRRPCLPVLWCVDFVEAIQDPRHLFKVKRPEYYMFEVVIDESSALLTTGSALVQLGSREAQHCFVNRCKNRPQQHIIE